MWPTPKYEIDDEDVYPPAEDTFILLDGLELERETLKRIFPKITLEIGSGSGVVTTFLREILSLSPKDWSSKSNGAKDTAPIFSFCTDLNFKSLKCSKNTMKLNDMDPTKLDFVNCDLLNPLLNRLQNQVDILIFNPPYVPSEKPAKNIEDLYYAGGRNGREIIDRILPLVSQILSPNGIFYLVAIRENQIPDLISSVGKRMQVKILLERQCGIEYLYVLKFEHNAKSLSN